MLPLCLTCLCFAVFVACVTYLHSSGSNCAALQQLQIGVEFEASTRMQDTSVSFGYQLDVPKANLQFKGIVFTKKSLQWVNGNLKS